MYIPVCDLRKCTEFLRVFLFVKWRWHQCSRLLWKREVVCGNHLVHGKCDVTQTAMVRRGEYQINRSTEPGAQDKSPGQGLTVSRSPSEKRKEVLPLRATQSKKETLICFQNKKRFQLIMEKIKIITNKKISRAYIKKRKQNPDYY